MLFNVTLNVTLIVALNVTLIVTLNVTLIALLRQCNFKVDFQRVLVLIQ